MELFNQHQKMHNLLPHHGEVFYYGCIYSKNEADGLYDYLINEIKWHNDQVIIFGKLITTKRMVAWYAEDLFTYTYSNITKVAHKFTDELIKIKSFIEQQTGESYNSCLLNLYHDGAEGMGWHSDNEKDLKKNGAIASISFGAERKFVFKNKQTKEVISVALQHGSLLVMKGETQTHWLHRLPPTKKVRQPRINLTFRTIVS